jgi:hypothetical protein
MASLFGKTGARGKEGNFVEMIIAKAKAGEPLKILNDVRMSPTYTHDAAYGLGDLIKTGVKGPVHLTNEGACTWFEFAQRVLEGSRLSASMEPVSCQGVSHPSAPTEELGPGEREVYRKTSSLARGAYGLSRREGARVLKGAQTGRNRKNAKKHCET